MKDWPETLKVNAAAAVLAQAIYYSRAEAWSVIPREWSELEYDERRVYLDLATRDLYALKPRRAA